MASAKTKKKLLNMAYGLGASVVILGALFKILHWELGPLNGGTLLAIGLITEALIFALSAFEPVDDDLDWSLVYPELKGELAVDRPKKKEELNNDILQDPKNKKTDSKQTPAATLRTL